MVIALLRKIQYKIIFSATDRYNVNLQEINRMSKSRGIQRSKKKPPQKTAKEKKQAKREKKNK